MAFQQYNVYDGLTAARVVATANQSGTYVNGPLNNGVGATFTYATGALTIDSVVIVAGDRVVLAAQSAANQNGVYVCTTTGATGIAAVLTRAADQQCIEQMKVGQYITIAAGTINNGSVYTIVEPLPAQLGISNLVMVAAVAPGVSGSFVVGNVPQASTTAGVFVDSGLPATALGNYAQVAMTAAQFNGMYAAPVLLVAAPGANLMIVVDSIALVMTYVSANYADGGVVAAQYDSTVHGAGVIASTTEAAADFFAAASTVFKLNAGAVLAPFTTCANKGLYLSNITGAFTTGDSTWIVKVRYHLVSTIA